MNENYSIDKQKELLSEYIEAWETLKESVALPGLHRKRAICQAEEDWDRSHNRPEPPKKPNQEFIHVEDPKYPEKPTAPIKPKIVELLENHDIITAKKLWGSTFYPKIETNIRSVSIIWGCIWFFWGFAVFHIFGSLLTGIIAGIANYLLRPIVLYKLHDNEFQDYCKDQKIQYEYQISSYQEQLRQYDKQIEEYKHKKYVYDHRKELQQKADKVYYDLLQKYNEALVEYKKKLEVYEAESTKYWMEITKKIGDDYKKEVEIVKDQVNENQNVIKKFEALQEENHFFSSSTWDSIRIDLNVKHKFSDKIRMLKDIVNSVTFIDRSLEDSYERVNA